MSHLWVFVCCQLCPSPRYKVYVSTCSWCGSHMKPKIKVGKNLPWGRSFLQADRLNILVFGWVLLLVHRYATVSSTLEQAWGYLFNNLCSVSAPTSVVVQLTRIIETLYVCVVSRVLIWGWHPFCLSQKNTPPQPKQPCCSGALLREPSLPSPWTLFIDCTLNEWYCPRLLRGEREPRLMVAPRHGTSCRLRHSGQPGARGASGCCPVAPIFLPTTLLSRPHPSFADLW